MMALAQNAWQQWCRFWFESNSPRNMKVFRFVFASLAFVYYSIRTLDLELFFSERGIMPLAAVRDVMPMEYRWSLLFWLTSTPALWVVHFVFLGALAALALGKKPRLAAFVAYVLHVSFMHRNMSPSYGVDLISTFFFLYLIFADYKSAKSMMGSIVYRLIQLQVCIIYAYSGLDKVRGIQWWGGEALWGVFANTQLARFDFSIVSHFPLAIVAITYATLAWEIYFPALVWVRGARNFMLFCGVLLHVGIGLVINIPFFGALMIASYIVFLDEGVLRKIESRIPSIARA